MRFKYKPHSLYVSIWDLPVGIYFKIEPVWIERGGYHYRWVHFNGRYVRFGRRARPQDTTLIARRDYEKDVKVRILRRVEC